MTREEYNDISAALDRIMKRVADDETLPQKAAIGAFGVLGGFQLFIKEYYEKHSTATPQGLDEAAEEWVGNNCFDCDCVGENRAWDAFMAGAKWMAEQGETKVLTVESPVLGPPMICCPVNASNGDKVIVQIRKI